MVRPIGESELNYQAKREATEEKARERERGGKKKKELATFTRAY